MILCALNNFNANQRFFFWDFLLCFNFNLHITYQKLLKRKEASKKSSKIIRTRYSTPCKVNLYTQPIKYKTVFLTTTLTQLKFRTTMNESHLQKCIELFNTNNKMCPIKIIIHSNKQQMMELTNVSFQFLFLFHSSLNYSIQTPGKQTNECENNFLFIIASALQLYHSLFPNGDCSIISFFLLLCRCFNLSAIKS